MTRAEKKIALTSQLPGSKMATIPTLPSSHCRTLFCKLGVSTIDQIWMTVDVLRGWYFAIRSNLDEANNYLIPHDQQSRECILRFLQNSGERFLKRGWILSLISIVSISEQACPWTCLFLYFPARAFTAEVSVSFQIHVPWRRNYYYHCWLILNSVVYICFDYRKDWRSRYGTFCFKIVSAMPFLPGRWSNLINYLCWNASALPGKWRNLVI